MEKGKKQKRKMKVQKGRSYDMICPALPCPQETAIAQNRKLQ
jgi:hypothetical protein